MLNDLILLLVYSLGCVVCFVGAACIIKAIGDSLDTTPAKRVGFREQTERERKISEYNKHRL